jgi:hypothetical protein
MNLSVGRATGFADETQYGARIRIWVRRARFARRNILLFPDLTDARRLGVEAHHRFIPPIGQ